MILNSLNFCLLKSFWFLHQFWMNPLLVRVILVVDFFPLNTLNISCHSLLACRVSAERSAVKPMGFTLYVNCLFSLAVFNILSFYLVFLVCVWVLACFSLDISSTGPFVPLGLDWLFPFPCWRNFQLQSLQKFSHTLSFSLLPGPL